MEKRDITRSGMTYLYIVFKLKEFADEGLMPRTVEVKSSKIMPFIQGFEPTIEEVQEMLHGLAVNKGWNETVFSNAVALFDYLPSEKQVIEDEELEEPDAASLIQEIIDKETKQD